MSWLFLEWRRYIQRRYLGCGTSLQQLALLRLLKRRETLSPVQVADFLHCDRPTATVVIKNLEKKGYLIRSRDEQNARQKHVTLTQAGAAYLQWVDATVPRVAVSPFDVLSESEKETLYGLLERCCRRMEEIKKEYGEK